MAQDYFDIAALEEAINATLPGATMFVRDVDLPESMAAMYTDGLIIREKAYIDASCRVMGMMTSHRYAILLNHMVDLGEFEQDTNWGLCVAQRDSHFKVLGQHTYDGKTMIVLLHLPDDERWKLFENTRINIEEEFFDSCCIRFENKCNEPVIPELATKDWLGRCSFPLGMDDEGNLWDLE